MKTKPLLFSIAVFLYTSCFAQKTVDENKKKNVFLETLLKQDTTFYNKYFGKNNTYEIQIIYTKVDRTRGNSPIFSTYLFQEDSLNYFYPASTVKLPVAVLALEKLHLLEKRKLNKYTIMQNDSAYAGQTRMYQDKTTKQGFPTVADHIKKMLIYSDNNAFNRLYEFLGPEYINKRLKTLGYNQVNIRHRLSTPFTVTQNSYTNPVVFLKKNGDTVYYKPLKKDHLYFDKVSLKKGVGYYDNDSLIMSPKDFNVKSKFGISNQHEFLKKLMFPKVNASNSKLLLASSDYKFLYKYMSMLPRESGYGKPVNSYKDSRVKYFMFGNSDVKIPDYIKIFNKAGAAYGFLVDNAYIIDLKNKIEFFVSAVINVNNNQIYDDNNYAYETDGLPFFEKLGQIIYDYELQRPRKKLPNLKAFCF
ncbi:serine hydrolase [Wocania ichthyoenteri]|uniref:serine hydrolase n=1 Tax=Wocania ichthyoenteri TaxID=1230531 RepID=UPI0006910B7C|nr:serine hydrolase [Wocania ichthyoenteri]